MTKPKVPKQAKKPTKQPAKRVRKPTAKRVATEVAKAEKGLEVEEVAPFPANKPTGTVYIPTGSKSSWVKQEDGKWKEVKNEG